MRLVLAAAALVGSFACAQAGTVSIEMSVVGNIATFTGAGSLDLSSYRSTPIPAPRNFATISSSATSNGSSTAILNEVPQAGTQYTTSTSALFALSEIGFGKARLNGASGDLFKVTSGTNGDTVFAVARGYNDGDAINFVMTISDFGNAPADLRFGTFFDDGINSVEFLNGTIQPPATTVPLPGALPMLLAGMGGMAILRKRIAE